MHTCWPLQVDLTNPEVVDECNYDRFQVQYVPLPEGLPYDGNLFKLHPALVRDIKLNVSVVRATRLHR